MMYHGEQDRHSLPAPCICNLSYNDPSIGYPSLAEHLQGQETLDFLGLSFSFSDNFIRKLELSTSLRAALKSSVFCRVLMVCGVNSKAAVNVHSAYHLRDQCWSMRHKLITSTSHQCGLLVLFLPLVIHAQQITDSHNTVGNMDSVLGGPDIARYHCNYSVWAH